MVAVEVSPEVRAALAAGRPVVALESTLITHGLPPPTNLEAALAAEAAVRAGGAVPATVAVWEGSPTVGLGPGRVAELASRRDVLKASRRDLGAAAASGRTAATTVSATMLLAHRAGIGVFATGGVGGVHRGFAESFDVSADLAELARTPVLVVCAGAKNILDLPRTVELLETLGVPIVGYRTDEFPAFTVRSSGLPVSARVDSPAEAARLFAAHRDLTGGGMLLCKPAEADAALDPAEYARWTAAAEAEAALAGVSGPEVTPFLLARVAEISGGRTLRANTALIVNNARLAAEVAGQLA